VIQRILSIDIGDYTARSAVIEINNQQMSLVDSAEVEVAAELLEDFSEHSYEEDKSFEQNKESNQNRESFLNEWAGIFSQLTSSLNSAWTNVVLVIPSINYLSLNLTLPFKDSRSISKVLDLEVQDLLPFDVSEFFVQHHYLGSLNGSGNHHDIHVSLIPRKYLKFILEACNRAGLEPPVVTTRAGALSAMYHLLPGKFSDNSALVYSDGKAIYLTSFIKGSVRADRIIDIGSNVQPESAYQSELKLSISALEKRYEKNLEKVYFLNMPSGENELKWPQNGRFSDVDFSELLPEEKKDFLIPLLASCFVKEQDPINPVTNFRTGEFSYRPQTREFLRGIKRCLPYFWALMILCLLSLPLTYYSRHMRIASLQDAIHNQVSAALPGNVSTPKGSELSYLQAENNRLETALSELGSRAETTPLHVFLELSRTLPDTRGINYSTILIGSRIKIEGSAMDYAAVDAIERSLRRNRYFCRVTKRTSAATGGRQGVSFDMDLRVCE
jgi:hypothetical protein